MSTPATTLQEQLDKKAQGNGFGTFQGVFCPTLLTILGVIMFLRLGWVVGQVGLLGAWAIILLASTITLCTALSISTITTNIRIGSGGAFSIISQSLGLEVGGAVGIPLYLCQALAVAMYIFGFREGWLFLFPHHPALLVDLGTFFCLFGISLVSAALAFRIQYLLLVILLVAIVSVFGTLHDFQPRRIDWVLEQGGKGDFWVAFAVFFPAVTGIMAGLNMSGELADPRTSIPKGTLAAVGVCTVIYLALAWWCSVTVSSQELRDNMSVMIDYALWPWVVIAGLLGATFSSGLSSLVGAPRILQALAQHRVVPQSHWLSLQTPSGEPRNAVLFTGLVVLLALMLRDLNAIATLLTMFFLIAYAMLNVVTMIEQKLALSSFRPLFRLHPLVPTAGAFGCIMTILVIHPLAGLSALILVGGFYGYLLGKKLEAPFGDVRSGLFTSLAEWIAKKVAALPGSERAWRPNMLVPVFDLSSVRGHFSFLKNLAHHQGNLKLVGLSDPASEEDLRKGLPELVEAFTEQGIYSSWCLLQGQGLAERVATTMEALRGSFFRPNILFLALPEDQTHDEELASVAAQARDNGLGVLVYLEHPRNRLGYEQNINIWVRDQSPGWDLSMDLGNKDISLLAGHLLWLSWRGHIRIICTVAEESERDKAQEYLQRLLGLARLPHMDMLILAGPFQQTLKTAPSADLNIFGLPETISLDFVRKTLDQVGTTCLFTRDSGYENVLA